MYENDQAIHDLDGLVVLITLRSLITDVISSPRIVN